MDEPTGDTTRRARLLKWWQDPKHPIWPLVTLVAKGAIALALLTIATAHGVEGQHHGGVDASDLSGIGGAGLAVKMAWDQFKS